MKDVKPRKGLNPVYKFLRDPGYLFYMDAPSIVSNTSQGGVPIQLNGRKVKDPVNRQVLTAHNINPDNPQIPKSFLEQAFEIAFAMRYATPYVGIDFIYGKGLVPLFLEANFSATLSPEGLGVSESEIRQKVAHPENHREVQKYLQKILVQRVVVRSFSNA